MPPEVAGIEGTAQARLFLRISGHDTGAPEAVEAVGSGARPSLEECPDCLAQFRVASEQDQDAAQMVAEDPVIGAGSGFERDDVELVRYDLVETTADQIRM